MNFLVIGTGLAGIAITETLRKRGLRVDVVHSTQHASSTAFATGMYNPVVFRRLQLSWMVDDLLPEMHRYLFDLESLLGISFSTPISFKKKIPNSDYATWWENRLNDPSFQPYLAPIDNGFGPVQNAGMVDCRLLQQAYIDYLQRTGSLSTAPFDFNLLQTTNTLTTYKGVAYDCVIFCEGPHAVQNPYFNWLPFKLCQGDWLVIKTEKQLTTDVINHKVNIIPMGNNHYKLSSTYSWQHLDWQPSQSAADELVTQFRELFDVPFDIVDHQAGLRPTVADRRPYLGKHPKHPSLLIFNGLGSKGVMLAPYFAKHLVAHVLDGAPLLKEVDIRRHDKRYAHATSAD